MLINSTYKRLKTSFWRKVLSFTKFGICMLMLVTVTSCEEVFTPDVQHEPVLCINSLISEGEPILVSVSKTRIYTDNPDQSKVDDASIDIYANGLLQSDSYIPKQGDEIEIRAKSTTVGEAQAKVLIPNQTKFISARWEPFDLVCISHDKNVVQMEFKLRVQLTIKDGEGDNYYSFSYHNMFPALPPWGEEGDSPQYNASHIPYYFNILNLQYDLEPIFSEHIGAFESLMGGEPDGFSFFTDRQFSGGEYTLNLQFNNCIFLGSLEEMPDCSYGFDLNTISPSYYNWLSFLWQMHDGTLSDFGDIGFGDPIWGYSNVSTGAGVVAAQSQYTLVIDFKDYITQVLTMISQMPMAQ